MKENYAQIASAVLALLLMLARSFYASRSVRVNADKVIAALRTEMVSEFGKLREEIATHRGQDREELRNWINGSFMRSATVQARLELATARDAELEKRIAALEG